jgi:hypothetical protein
MGRLGAMEGLEANSFNRLCTRQREEMRKKKDRTTGRRTRRVASKY